MFILINHSLTALDRERFVALENVRLRYLIRQQDERIMELMETMNQLRFEIRELTNHA